MSNFFIAIAVFLITIIGALFAVPYLIDWNGYRGVFEEEATQLMGREVRVGGAVNLHLLPTPYFRLEKVRIADTSVNLQDAFIRVESLSIKLSVPPLFRGVVEANEIELQRPVLRLAVDGNDNWNWQSFSQTLGNAAYLPHNVTLTSVKITDGLLAMHGPDGSERARFEGFTGELSAPSLEGPYRYRGTFGKAGNRRDLRIGTAVPEGDGAVRFKAIVRGSQGASTYTLDGRLADLKGKPRIEGELNAKLPIAGLWQMPVRPAIRAREPAGEGESRRDQSDAAFELRAAVHANPTGATLSDLALSFEQDGKPQLLSGELKAVWRDALAVELNLSSRWLDLDRIAGAGDAAGPLDSIVPIALGLRDLLPAVGRSRASFSVDNANVGREAVSALRLALVRSEDRLEIEELRLGLPGGSRGELKGVVSGPADAPTFDGSLNLRGASLVRFLGWATAGALTSDTRGDGTYGVRTQLSIAPGRAAARDLVGDISGTAITAAAQYRWEGRPELSLQVEGPQLDARAFVPAGASLGDIFDLILHGPATSQAAAQNLGAARPAWRSGQFDTLVRINAGQVITAARTYRDVAMEIELKGGRLRLPLLRVAGDAGFSLELEGDVGDAASRPKGSLRATVGAETAQAIAPLAELLGIPDGLRPGTSRAQAMVPLRLAGSMTFGVRTQTSADLVLDGEANGARVNLNARFDGGQGGWRSGPADLTGLIEGGDAKAVAALVAPGGSTSRSASTGPGRALVKATGVPSQGLATLASVEAGDLALSFRGQVVVAETGNTASGSLDIKATDGARVAALAGLTPALQLDGMPVAGSLNVSVAGSKIAMERIGLKVGGGDLRGQIALSTAGDGRRIEARVDVDELSVAKLLSPLLDQRLAVAAAAETVVTGQRSPWPDEPFDASMLDQLEGTIQLTTKRFVLADGVGLGKAAIDIAIEAGKMEVTRIEGEGVGGRYDATLRIAKAAGGMDVSGSMRLAGGSIEALGGTASGKPRASGTIAGEVKFNGKGASPRGVLSVLQGSGTLELGEAKLGALWPGAVGKAAEAALKTDPDSLPTVLRQALATGLGNGETPLPATVGLEIADGRLVAKPFTIETADGRASGSASLDLKTLGFESDWRLEQRPGAAHAGKQPLPGVTVSYRGPFAALGAIEPRVNSEALERELAVRRMERDVEELERLRRLDEARRREEAERQRRQLEQAPLPPGPVPVAPAARPATPG